MKDNILKLIPFPELLQELIKYNPLKNMKPQELQLKHISNYLPFDLLVLDFVNGGKSLSNDTYVLKCGNVHRCLTFASQTEKPVMRPLDLTKEIEHNGEKFIPMEYLTKMFDLNTNDYELRFENLVFVLYNKKSEYYQINDNNFYLFEKLYEWHFAINIPEHLYININTLEQ